MQSFDGGHVYYRYQRACSIRYFCYKVATKTTVRMCQRSKKTMLGRKAVHRVSFRERTIVRSITRGVATFVSDAFGKHAAAFAVVALLGQAPPACADDYYKNKQIKLIVGTDVGGSYDLSGRLVAHHLSRHIPGNPQIVVQNMPGAGSIVATNYISEVAPQDGTVIAAVLQTLLQSQLTSDKLIKFDGRRLNWIGNPSASVNVIVTWHDSDVKTFQQAQQKSVAIGITSPASSGGIEVAIANNLLGTLFKPVTGYKGGNEVDIAMERGEVFGRAGQSWGGWKQTRSDWIRDKRLNVLVQIGPKPSDDLPNVPLLSEIPADSETKHLVRLYSDTIALGRPLVVGSKVPSERVAIIRKAFRDLMSDPEYRAEAGRLGIDVEPVYGEELQEIVERTLSTPAELISKLNAARTLRSLATDR